MKTKIKVEVEANNKYCLDCDLRREHSDHRNICLAYPLDGGYLNVLNFDKHSGDLRCQQCLDSEVK